MKKLLLLSSSFLFSVGISFSQTTALNFSGADCNGYMVDLFDDLEAGKAVVLFFYMPNCGSCPPHAKKIEAMGGNINATYPGMFKAYAFPFQNSTTCSYSNTWVNDNNLSLFAPMDSGAVQVDYYGGFQMPTAVLLGGVNKNVLYNSNVESSPSDTVAMKNAILTLFAQNQASINENQANKLKVYPNPASENFIVQLTDKTLSSQLQLTDVTGKIVFSTKISGETNVEIPTQHLKNGQYTVVISSENGNLYQNITILH